MVRASTSAIAAKPKAKKAAPKTAKAKAAHPPTAEMVTDAIKTLEERGGSSLSAIKKYLAGNYAVDVDRLAPFIKKFLKSAVLSEKGAKPRAAQAKEKKPAAPKKLTKAEKEKAALSKKPAAASPKKVTKKKAATKTVRVWVVRKGKAAAKKGAPKKGAKK